MFDPASIAFAGPLSPFVSGFWAELIRQGYARYSARNLLYVAAHLSRWLAPRRLGSADLTEARIDAFISHRRRRGCTQFLSARAVEPLITYLRELGVAPSPTPTRPATTVRELLLCDYGTYLVRERGLGTTTIRAYLDFARHFFALHPRPRNLAAEQITRFILQRARSTSISYAKCTVTALRSLLRFLHVHGVIRNDLASCVPAIASWRMARLPKHLDHRQVQRLSRAYDSRSASGRRDAAIVQLLLRVGLRAGEVAALRLEDIDWRAGELHIHGKGRREGRLPLPPDVGRALAMYLRRGRPRSESRHAFVRARAPFRSLTTSGVIGAASRALRRAGVAEGGAHLLRHTAATQMLRAGASLSEIGHVLRHRHIDTTAIYAKVDFNALRPLAKRWPGGAR
jgi:integrase/recombinase XerD